MDKVLDQPGASSFIAVGAHDRYLNDTLEVKLFTPLSGDIQPTVPESDTGRTIKS